MATFAEKLAASFLERKNAIRMERNGQESPEQLIARFEEFLQNEIEPGIRAIETGEGSRPSANTTTHCIGDDHDCLDDSLMWKEMVYRMAARGYVMYKTRYIEKLSDEELNDPKNSGLGRIGGRPTGVSVMIIHRPEIQMLEMSLAGKLPLLSRVKADMKAEFDERDAGSAGNVFRVQYELGRKSQAGSPHLCVSFI